MSAGSMIVTVELRAGARLFLYPQQAGGSKWCLTGARITPASLDKICDAMLSEGLLESGDERGEYRLWQANRTQK